LRPYKKPELYDRINKGKIRNESLILSCSLHLLDILLISTIYRGLERTRATDHDNNPETSGLHARQYVPPAKAHLERRAGGLVFLYRTGEGDIKKTKTAEPHAAWLERWSVFSHICILQKKKTNVY
jgi:hypothetical protein